MILPPVGERRSSTCLLLGRGATCKFAQYDFASCWGGEITHLPMHGGFAPIAQYRKVAKKKVCFSVVKVVCERQGPRKGEAGGGSSEAESRSSSAADSARARVSGAGNGTGCRQSSLSTTGCCRSSLSATGSSGINNFDSEFEYVFELQL